MTKFDLAGSIPLLIVATAGALVHVIVNPQKTWSKTLARLVGASISGVIFGFLAIEFFGSHEYLTLAITGASGYIGPVGLEALAKVLQKKILDKLGD